MNELSSRFKSRHARHFEQDNDPRSEREQYGRLLPLEDNSIIWMDRSRTVYADASLHKFVEWMQKNFLNWRNSNVVVVTHSTLIQRDTGQKLDYLGAVRVNVFPDGRIEQPARLLTQGLPEDGFRFGGLERCSGLAQRWAGNKLFRGDPSAVQNPYSDYTSLKTLMGKEEG